MLLVKEMKSFFDVAAPEPETAVMQPPNYRIDLYGNIAGSGPKDRARLNQAALEMLYRIEAEGRPATRKEMDVLVRYAAYGGTVQAVDSRSGWKEQHTALAELLSAEDLESVQASTPYAFFTPPKIARAMWDGLARLGFAGGRVLEPAMGTGHFVGAMPRDLAEKSHVTGVEVDQVSGRIAQLLYPRVDVYIEALQKAGLEDDFDVVIGNVPFGQAPVYDPAFDNSRQKFLLQSIHNYFMAKSLSLVRPGGLVALIVSRYFMDAKETRIRAYLAEQANLVGAFRLHNETFRDIAGTDVTADVIILQRRGGDHMCEVGIESDWVKTSMVDMADDEGEMHPIRINRVFADYDMLMLGEPHVGSNQYGPAFELRFGERPLYKSLAEAMRWVLPQGGYVGQVIEEEKAEHRVTADDELADGAYFVNQADARIYQNDGGVGRLVRSSKKTLGRIAGMIKVRDVARELLAKNLDPDADLRPYQQKLMWQYQLFVSRYGFLNNNANRSAFKGDPDAPFLRALELYDEDSGRGEPASIFFKRTIGDAVLPDQVGTAREALALSLNVYGHINWGYMEELTARPFDDLFDELEGIVYQEPSGRWVTTDEYLSGNVREKLIEARTAAERDGSFQANVMALERVLPDDLLPDEIVASLGTGWIPADVTAQFLNEMLDEESLVNNLDVPGYEFAYEPPEYGRVLAQYIPGLGQWTVGGTYSEWGVLATEVWGTGRIAAISLAQMGMNSQTPTVYDTHWDGQRDVRILNHEETILAREKLAAIKEVFGRWVWATPERRERLAPIYNEQFNSIVPRAYDGSHLTLPGLGVDMPALRPHQKNVIWRIMQGGNVLMWHIVGAGKTYPMIGAGMEMRRLGLRRKVMHVVPNHLIEQYATNFYRMYPAAVLLLVNGKGMSKHKRAETLARIATGDWDAIIITHSAFGRIPLDPQTWIDFHRRQIEVLEDYLFGLDKSDPDQRLSFKEIKLQKERFEAKLEERQAQVERGHDAIGLTWEQLGVDMLFVDEAHEFKNLWFATKMTRIPGLGGGESGRAMDMFLKTQWITRRCVCGRILGQSSRCECARSNQVKNGSVVFATGTALANSVAEMYTMQRYLQYDELLNTGLAHFDAWARQFGDTVTLLELKPSGTGWRQNTRFAKFNNVPELLRLFNLVADMQADPDALGIVRPSIAGGKPVGVETQPGDEFMAYMADCAARADNLPNVEPWEDNILKIMGDAAKAALHMRLVDSEIEDDPDSKVNRCAEEVYRIWQETTGVELAKLPGEKVNLTQIVFLDTSTPKPEFNLYQYLKDRLVGLGMPTGDIAFIHDAKNDEARQKLFDRMNEGSLRVLIGSTTKMGTGANMQRLLKAQHDLDAPWRPADVDQRQGRTQRQGNLNDDAEFYRYVTSGSLDFYKWHLLELKAKFIKQIMEGSVSQRSIEDIDAVVIGFAEMKAMATGDGLMIEQVEVGSRLNHLYALLSRYRAQRRRLKAELSGLPARAQRLAEVVRQYGLALETLEKNGFGGEFEMMVLGHVFRDRKQAGKVLTESVVLTLDRGEVVEDAAVLYGLPIQAEMNHTGQRRASIRLSSGVALTVDLGVKAVGNVARLVNALRDLPKKRAEKVRQLDKIERQIPQMESRLEAPFEYHDEMVQLEKRHIEIEAEIERRYKESLNKERQDVAQRAAEAQASRPDGDDEEEL